MNPFVLLKWLHVLSVITAVGSSMTYGLLLANATRQPAHLVFALKTIRFVDSRLATPAYIMALIIGLAMVFTAGFPITTPWILASLILYAAILLVGIAVYTPVFRRQMQLAESEGAQSKSYQSAARIGNILLMVTTGLAVLIVFLMVVKPSLW